MPIQNLNDKENKGLRGAREDLSQKIQALTQEFIHLEKIIRDYEKRISQYEETVLSLNAKLNGTKKDLENVTDINRQLNQAIDYQIEQNIKFQENLEWKEKVISELNGALGDSNKRFDDLARQSTQIMDGYTNELQSQSQEIKKLKKDRAKANFKRLGNSVIAQNRKSKRILAQWQALVAQLMVQARKDDKKAQAQTLKELTDQLAKMQDDSKKAQDDFEQQLQELRVQLIERPATRMDSNVNSTTASGIGDTWWDQENVRLASEVAGLTVEKDQLSQTTQAQEKSLRELKAQLEYLKSGLQKTIQLVLLVWCLMDLTIGKY